MFYHFLYTGSHYNIPEGLVYSFPVRFTGGSWCVVDDIDLTDDQKEQLNTTVQVTGEVVEFNLYIIKPSVIQTLEFINSF